MPSRGSHPTAFNAADAELKAGRLRAAKACRDYNALDLEATVREKFLIYCRIVNRVPTAEELSMTDEELKPLFPGIRAPLDIGHCKKLSIGTGGFINSNLYISDNPLYDVSIGDRVLFGPNVQIHSISHELHWADRNGSKGPGLCAPVKIGNDVWIGASVIILPGITIGDRSVVGAGCVVTKDVPAEHIVLGNPMRISRRVPDKLPTTGENGVILGHNGPDNLTNHTIAAQKEELTTLSDAISGLGLDREPWLGGPRTI